MKRYAREDQVRLAMWAADCAERVLPYVTADLPGDDRARYAIDTLRDWVISGAFAMRTIRGASLDAHAAAKARNRTRNVQKSSRRAARSMWQQCERRPVCGPAALSRAAVRSPRP